MLDGSGAILSSYGLFPLVLHRTHARPRSLGGGGLSIWLSFIPFLLLCLLPFQLFELHASSFRQQCWRHVERSRPVAVAYPLLCHGELLSLLSVLSICHGNSGNIAPRLVVI